MEILNVGLGEMIVIIIIALLVLGPERLPEAARHAARLFAQLQAITNEVRRVLTEEAQEIQQPFQEAKQQIQEAKKEIEGVAKPLGEMKEQIQTIGNPMQAAQKELKASLSLSSLTKTEEKQTDAAAPTTDKKKSTDANPDAYKPVSRQEVANDDA